MKIVKFNRWATMLHILPDIKALSEDLFNDALSGEPYEVLLRRYGTLVENIRELSIQADTIIDLNERSQEVVDILRHLSHQTQDAYRLSLNINEYEDLRQSIFEVHNNVSLFVQGLAELQNYVYTSDAKGELPAGAA